MEVSLSDLYSNVRDHLEEREHSSDNSGDNSPSTTNFASINSPKRSRRAIQKKVVTIPLKDLEGSKFKGECTPPSDSWAWRKYGQKPIKGSPYPRGYYRCSSSKGCPARKQVERSRSDPTMLVVTYSYDHNHPWPTSRSHHQNRASSTITTTTTTTTASSTREAATQLTTSTTTTTTNPNNNQTIQFQQNNTTTNNISNNNNNNDNNNNDSMDHLHQPLMIPPIDELTWLSTDNDILQNDFLFNNSTFNDVDMARFFPVREEDESLFADLGELPECSVVFRRAAAAAAAAVAVGGEEQHQTPWCGSTG